MKRLKTRTSKVLLVEYCKKACNRPIDIKFSKK